MDSPNIVKMDEKGKITIPVSIRKQYRWEAGSEFEIIELNGRITLIPIVDLDDLPKITITQYSKIYDACREEELDLEKQHNSCL